MEKSDSYINSHILYLISETSKNNNHIFSNIKSNRNNNNKNIYNDSIKEEDSLYVNTLINNENRDDPPLFQAI